MSVRPIPLAFESIEFTALLFLRRFLELATEESWCPRASRLIDMVTVDIEAAS